MAQMAKKWNPHANTTAVLKWNEIHSKYNKIATHRNMAPASIERGVMSVCYPCDIFISVKVFPLLCFQIQKAEYQSK